MTDTKWEIKKTIEREGDELDARTSEAIDRMCIASAKLRGSNLTEEKDLERVVTILSNSYFSSSNYEDIKRELKFEEKKPLKIEESTLNKLEQARNSEFEEEEVDFMMGRGKLNEK